MNSIHRVLGYLAIMVLLPLPGLTDMPDAIRNLDHLTSHADLTRIVQDLAEDPLFTVSEAGKSHEGRSLWLLRIVNPAKPANWRIFFYAQQHGNEPAGKEALLYLAQAIHKDPKLLPKGVELWLLPMVNPDGAEQDQRRNAVGADLNRDHMTLDQPETQALHQAFRTIKPHLSIDCHEFGRDSDDYREKGWLEWQEIMMDYANQPLLNDAKVALGADLVQRMGKVINKQGINFHRYFVGGVPPDGEQRFSAPDMDGGLNGAAIYGGLSFIIEGGVYRLNNEDNHDLPRRVYNYTVLLQEILKDKRIRKAGLALERAQPQPTLPDWIPTNYFWAKLDESTRSIPVIDAGTRQVLAIPAPNFMPDLVIKKSVSRPLAYVVQPEQATLFASLLERHAIPFQALEQARGMRIEGCVLDSLENEFDELYQRYAGRVVVSVKPVETKMLAPGCLIIPVDDRDGLRVLALLEPTQLYGLYQYQSYLDLLGPEGLLPVARVLAWESD